MDKTVGNRLALSRIPTDLSGTLILKRIWLFLLLPATPVAGIAALSAISAMTFAAAPPEMAPGHQQADLVLVDKSDRRLELWRDDKIMKTYRIALGGNPTGHKQFEGDEKTPEGTYVLDWRNADSVAHLSLHISYPNAADSAFAKAQSKEPGGMIMIHGILNGFGWLGAMNPYLDWTDGCIAVTNREMEEIWSMVPNGTPIQVQP